MPRITYRKITIFWLPLAATWLMMALEGPFLAAVIARLNAPKFNLAAYGVAFSFALIIEAPIIMMMSASTALVKNRLSYIKMRHFTYLLNAIITGLMLIFLIPPVFDFIARDVIGLQEEVARLTHYSTLILLPWPAAIGFRRFYQGIMIRFNMTRRVAYGTIIRLLTMSLTALMLYRTNLSGAYVGAFALSVGVVLEALMSRLMVGTIIKKLCGEKEKHPEDTLTYSYILNFYYPLALTSILGLAVQPLITFFMGHSKMALNSLAVLPVINSLIFIFRSVGLSYQEVSIALMGGRGEGFRQLRNFSFFLASSVTLILGTIAFTDLSHFWFGTISGLSAELVSFAVLPTQILTVLPGLAVLLAFQRSIMVSVKKTRPVTGATAIEVLGIVIVLSIAIYYFNLVGATAAALAMLIGRFSANMYLYKPVIKGMEGVRKHTTPSLKE